MLNTRYISLSVGVVSVLCLTVAIFLQHIGMSGVFYPPCPLCILQRCAFLGIAIFSLVYYFSSKKLFLILAFLSSITGVTIAIRHAWVIIHPETSCGIDPLEVLINNFHLASLLPWFFKADGFCSASLPPVIGLSVPEWSLLFFITLSIIIFINVVVWSRRYKRVA
jgi:disulfide bond formation protein DsbB